VSGRARPLQSPEGVVQANAHGVSIRVHICRGEDTFHAVLAGCELNIRGRGGVAAVEVQVLILGLDAPEPIQLPLETATENPAVVRGAAGRDCDGAAWSDSGCV